MTTDMTPSVDLAEPLTALFGKAEPGVRAVASIENVNPKRDGEAGILISNCPEMVVNVFVDR